MRTKWKISAALLVACLSIFYLVDAQEPQNEFIPVRIQWDHDGENTAGYKVYFTTNAREGGRPYELLGDYPARVNGTPVEVQLPIGMEIWLVVTAYSEFGVESAPSPSIYIPLFRPNAPTRIFIPAQIITEQGIIQE